MKGFPDYNSAKNEGEVKFEALLSRLVGGIR
jgi:hypothetical protein